MARKRHIVRDKSTAFRTKELGDIGERLASEVLSASGFVDITPLNDSCVNYKYADFYARRNGECFVISVKARNKYEHTGKLNSRYKLGKDAERLARLAEEKWKAKAAWISISVEATSFSAYFGLLSQLTSNGIPMTGTAIKKYECLALNQVHNLDHSSIANVYRPVEAEI